MTFREKVYQQCLQLIADKTERLQAIMDDLRESIKNETKSTVGDKHETARAHLQIEQENTGRQLKELQAQQAILQQLDVSVKAAAIINGSLVQTNKGYFFISIAGGKIIVDGIPVFILSPQSPLGTRLMGLMTGDTTTVNGMSYQVEKINEA